VGFDLAGAIAPIARQRVPVVTLLNAILIVDSIAAALWDLGSAANGAFGVAHIGCATGRRATRPDGRDERSTASVLPAAAKRASTSLADSSLNTCTAAANYCECAGRGEAETKKLACG